MKLCPELLVCIVESIALNGSFKRAAQAAQISESTLFLYLTKSKAAEKIGNIKSEFRFHWREVDDFLHNQVRRAKSECVLASVYSVMEEQRFGRTEMVYDPATGRPVQALNYDVAHLTDDEMRERGLHPKRDRFMWHEDQLGERIPVFQTKVVAMPSALRAKILTGIAPSVFGDRIAHDITHKESVVHQYEPAPFRPKIERIESGEITEDEFSEVQATGLERPDIAELRARAAKLLATPLSERNTVPQGVVRDANLQPVNVGRRAPMPDDPPDDVPIAPPTEFEDLRDHPRSYQRAAPQPEPRPHGKFPAHSDPNRVGARAMQVVK